VITYLLILLLTSHTLAFDSNGCETANDPISQLAQNVLAITSPCTNYGEGLETAKKIAQELTDPESKRKLLGFCEVNKLNQNCKGLIENPLALLLHMHKETTGFSSRLSQNNNFSGIKMLKPERLKGVVAESIKLNDDSASESFAKFNSIIDGIKGHLSFISTGKNYDGCSSQVTNPVSYTKCLTDNGYSTTALVPASFKSTLIKQEHLYTTLASKRWIGLWKNNYCKLSPRPKGASDCPNNGPTPSCFGLKTSECQDTSFRTCYFCPESNKLYNEYAHSIYELQEGPKGQCLQDLLKARTANSTNDCTRPCVIVKDTSPTPYKLKLLPDKCIQVGAFSTIEAAKIACKTCDRSQKFNTCNK
jgi:hypothetical protein